MNFFMKKENINVYIYFSIVLIVGLAYFSVLYVLYGLENVASYDLLNQSYKNNVVGLGNIGGWSISHFVAFYIAGFLFPQQWVLIFILGVLWELVENIGADLVNFEEKSKLTDSNMYQNKWMCGNLSDIIFNSIGLFLGYWTSIYIGNKKDK